MDTNWIATSLSAAGLGAYVPLVLALVGLASIILKLLPASTPGAALHTVRTVLGVIAAQSGPVPVLAPPGTVATPALVTAPTVPAKS